jgi:hypothetical protein
MKKQKLNPLELDKATISLLDANQLQDVIGGVNIGNGFGGASSTSCSSGSSVCCAGPVSTGCGAGSSTCRVVAL